MRKLIWMVVMWALALPLLGQSRRGGYSPSGGWHRKASAPAPRSDKKRTDKRPPQSPPRPAPPKSR